jgi:hypothetical protein
MTKSISIAITLVDMHKAVSPWREMTVALTLLGLVSFSSCIRLVINVVISSVLQTCPREYCYGAQGP